MLADSSTTEKLLRLAVQADRSALAATLDRHRVRLRRMVAARLDPRITARVDPSDLVQETLADSVQRLPEYLRDRPVPYWVWLKRLALRRPDMVSALAFDPQGRVIASGHLSGSGGVLALGRR